MKLVVFGGTGGVGQHVVKQALDAGHTVTAYARNPSALPRASELSVVKGELHDMDAISTAIKGADAVLSTLGARQNTPDQVDIFGNAMRHIISAMKQHGVKRLVAISGAGIIIPGDEVTFGRRFIKILLGVLSRYVGAAKQREYEIISASGLDWVLIRPPRIIEGDRTGIYRVFPGSVPSPKISQGDVADLMLNCATSDEWVRKAPIPGY